MSADARASHVPIKTVTSLSVRDFDVHDWRGLTELLKAGKNFLTDPIQYAEFRNLVLSYAQTKGDSVIQKQIDDILVHASREQQMTADGDRTAPTISQTSHGRGRRIQPRFGGRDGAPQASQKELLQTAPPQIESKYGDEKAVADIVTLPADSPREDFVIPTPVIPSPTPVSEVVVAEPSPSESQSTVSEPRIDAPKTVEEYKARIAEIKHHVHETFGNPAAVMDLPNNQGRVYMTALLGALKATGAGSSVGTDSAMRTLEEAFSVMIREASGVDAVNELAQKNTEVVSEVISSVTPQIADIPASPIRNEVVEEISAPLSVPEPSIPDEVAPVAHEYTPPPSEGAESVETRTLRVSNDNEVDVVDDTEQSVHELDVVSPEIVAREESAREVPLSPPELVHTVPPTIPEKVLDEGTEPHRHKHKLKPKQEHKVRDPESLSKKPVSSEVTEYDAELHDSVRTAVMSAKQEELQEEKSHQVVVKQSELGSPRITKALYELLNEWSIFSGSGMFGIGPGGHEHPLYLKLAPLSMSLVLTGRWEGSSPKLLRALKEYVDAWRHEQTVSYAPNETFEHYLRRVVQRILRQRDFD